ncbi:MAG: quinone-interacting membrane-bound oxidoreductase complex subunit QmoC [SAR324 cluster bacterium]|jgi:quinone-modifying oxidoreductase subunit QmoC|nr:quinone-interacting membrane-bound oxidoreductase complex subunit QmoC [SAR324 cluster bacterium]MDP7175167.1 quinone-interacting membrane-bound oxidoreductase complex subunit QmoC [SAR324 cluster bacterium]MDP7582512.1 quinone-interacting membrane-bound oxidoreductase complex subunit QmoC [SAR324 cluster bacterium]|tara:strand:- start:2085 stop:3242 length:1158 start_codon:yes stop_codon:yes gene_type:complete
MTGRVAVSTDLNFVEGLMLHGAADLKKCYQCSTCTVACPLTPDDQPFPRKEMLWAQWGMQEKLVRDMDLWLCHNCNDCTDQCPRGAKPGEVMSALRNKTIEHYSYPQAISKAAKTGAGNIVLFLIPMILVALAIVLKNMGNDFAFLTAKPVVYANMLPVTFVDLIFLPAGLFALFNAYMGISKFIGGLKKQYPPTEEGETFVASVRGTIQDVLSHIEFKKCLSNKSRNIWHRLMMYGFLGLFLTTNAVMILHYMKEFGFDVQGTPLPFFHPVKILGNVSAVAAFIGIYFIVRDRVKNSAESVLSLFDWMFIGNMFFTVVTGILCQVFRVSDQAALAFSTYYIHLVMVFYLIAYAPQTKFGHIFFRPAAMIYSRYSGRNKNIFRNL